MTDDTRNDDDKITDARSTDKESGEPQSTDASDTGNVVDINRWRDFNDAEPQRLDDAWPAHAVQSTDEIKARMLVHIRGVLSYLFPGGVFQRGNFFVGDIRGNPGDSLVIEIEGRKAGLWHDFATGEGGDIIGLWAAANGRDTRTEFPAVIEDVVTWLDGRARTLHDDRVGRPSRKAPAPDGLGPVTAKWDYLDDDGRLIACVYRYDPPGGKQFRPWDVRARKARAPEPRPLYNRPGIKAADEVEGEKAAEALIAQGLCATTAMNGASAPVEKTDWSPLKARRVVVWPDHDEPGWRYALAAAQAVLAAGAAAVSVLNPPAGKPEKWDAADAVAEGMDVAAFIAGAGRQAIRPAKRSLDLADWHAGRYAGDAPEQRFLIDGSVPLGVVSILAAMGDTGKGMMTLDLALSVATGRPRAVSVSPEPMAFGGAVRAFGAAMLLTAEDDEGEVHRRLERLDPERLRLARPERLIVVPLPNAGGPIPLVTSGPDGPMATEHFTKVRDQIVRITDLKLVVLDPLSSFMHADINADPAAGSFATGLLASLATEIGAAVIVAHHMRKPQGNRPISTVEQARDAVRGTSAIVDGVRLVYALWPAPEEHRNDVFRALEERFARNAVFQGAVVKANGPADRTIRTYLRAPTGLLVDVTARLRDHRRPDEDLKDALVGHLSEAQARAFRIADNRIAENAGWDDELLRVELEQLREAEFDLDLTGFELDEIDRLLQADGPVGNIDDDEVSEPPENPVTRPGDLWLLGGHRLLCGDATVLGDVERALDGGLADLCFTDPPYNVDYGNSAKDRMRGKKRRIHNDNLGKDFERFLYDACVNILTVTKGAAYVCMSSSELPKLQRAFREAGGHWSTFVIWAKNTFTLGRADYQRQYEPILYGWKEGTDHYWCGARDQGDVWFVDKPARNDLHPTMKPVALIERALRNSSKSRDVVLDPFAGSGSTLIAAEKTGRTARLVELDPGYCDVIVKRWQEWTGKAACLDGEGGSFEQVSAERRGGDQESAAR